MLLDRIEIDSHGPLNRVELGSLSHHLNVVMGAAGSGKTAISRFIRDSLIDRDYPRGMLSGSAGRVVWVHQNGWIHCRREQDGSPGGRRSVEFEARGETAGSWEGYADGWFDTTPTATHDTNGYSRSQLAGRTARTYRSSLASRTLGNIRIPESIVDGVMVDTTVSSASRVVAACITAGLDQPDLARLPIENETARFSRHGANSFTEAAPHTEREDRERRMLREELADVEAELSKLQAMQDHDRSETYIPPVETIDPREVDSLHHQRAEQIRRRNELIKRREEMLRNRHRYQAPVAHYTSPFGPIDTRYSASHTRSQWEARESRLRTLHQRADQLRSRAAELQRWVRELDAHATDRMPAYYGNVDSYASSAPHILPSHWQTTSTEHLQNRIRQADQEIVTLHRVLADVRSLRDLLAASVAASPIVGSYDWLDDDWMRGRRYDHFVRAIDRYSSDRPWADFYDHAYRPLRPVDDLAMRIEATTRHLNWLLSRFERTSTSSTHAFNDSTWMLEDDRGGFIEASLRRVCSQLRQRDYISAAHMDAVTVELTRALDHLLAHRRRVVETLSMQHTHWKRDFAGISGHHPDWTSERRTAFQELSGIENELRRVLDQTASLRHAQRHLPIVDSIYSIGMSDIERGPYVMHSPFDQGQSEALRAEVRWLDSEITQGNRRIGELDARIAHCQSLRNRAQHNTAPIYTATSHHSDINRLRRRRDELISELNRYRPVVRRESSLAELASRWLIRLSGGRHQIVRWSTTPVAADPYTTLAAEQDETSRRGFVSSAQVAGRQVNVEIDNVQERNLPAATRAIACLAVRLAAGELLGRMGHAIPLVLETHRELFDAYSTGYDTHREHHSHYRHAGEQGAYRQWTREGLCGDAIASALADYSAAGRQLLILTEHGPLADFLARCGARQFALHTQRIVHPHQPLWRSGERNDHYSGPHAIATDGLPAGSRHDDYQYSDAGSINRAFDHAWRESAGLRDEVYYGDVTPTYRTTVSPQSTCNASATDMPVAGAQYRDGYHYTDQSSTYLVGSQPAVATVPMHSVAASLTARHHDASSAEVDDVPFFLTVDSPIDAAPSIDAVAAQRLRRIGISHITHLMNQDSNRLADTLGLAGVDARTVRRWQAECRLMCRVPQLRGFDARVLVGCGIADPAQLAAIHPTDLLDRVKTFLATERGQRILLSGTSYELSRITSWIASANRSVLKHTRTRTVDGRRVQTRDVRDSDQPVATPRTRYLDSDDVYLTDDDFDQERYEVQLEQRADRIADELDELTRDFDGDQDTRPLRTRRVPEHRSAKATESSPASRENTSSNRSQSSNGSRSTRQRIDRESTNRTRAERARDESSRKEQNVNRSERRDSERESVRALRSASERATLQPIVREDRDRKRAQRSERVSTRGEQDRQFYLERASDVVDAPSIGPRMAERLNKIGIYTVDDLLQADPGTIAASLNHRRIDESTVLQWQQQAALVCRVPMLRGHDAQFLVAAGMTTPEQLAASDPVSLFAEVEAIAHSAEGKRIVRGGKLPDLEEVTEWIEYATQHRSLKAA
jgi:predicted flap endonuclease-1-like 5' DNA nuclease